MNIRKLLARLNAKSPQLHIGSGGIPELTPQDIAAALGMVEDRIGREIFCMAWWPDGANLTRKDLRDGLKNLLFDEYRIRHHEAYADRLERHLLDKPQLRDKAKYWPVQVSRYGQIADAVVLEICAPKICKQCGGRGEMIIESRVISCESCKGLGLLAASHAWRAERIGVGDTAYRDTWKPVYEWLYDRASRRESAAAQQLARALGDVEQAA